MSFLDSVQSAVNKGTAAVGRSTQSVKLKMQVSELIKKRQNLAAQLGASLYETTKDDQNMRQGREELYDGIAKIDEEKASLEQEIAKIESEAEQAHNDARVYKCPKCGANVGATDMFCSGCGISIDEVKAAYAKAQETLPEAGASQSNTKTCVNCGAAIEQGAVFCMNCGAKQE